MLARSAARVVLVIVLSGYDFTSRGGNVLSWTCAGAFAAVALAAISTVPVQQQDAERIIHNMVDHAIARFNRGDFAALEEFWDEQADYVGVDGTLMSIGA